MNSIRKNRKGQFLVSSALLIAILFIFTAATLSSTIITNVKILKDNFRRDAMQIVSSFRGVLNLALAEVSQELELRSSLYDYENYSTLAEYPEATLYGNKTIVDWHNLILLQYAGRSVNINVENVTFECDWNSSVFHSKASAILSLSILKYGFYGLKQNVTSELKLQLLSKTENGQNVTLKIRLQKENNLSVTDLNLSFIKIFYKENTGDFVEAERSSIRMKYLGNGVYNISFSAIDYAEPVTIKMVLRDERGIIVAAIPESGVIISEENDASGPLVVNPLCSPNPCPNGTTLTLTAIIDDTTTGGNIVVAAEYYIDSNETIFNLSPSDGYFDSPYEAVEAEINVSVLSLGEHIIYIRGMDALGNYGNYTPVRFNVTESCPKMHVKDIHMNIKPWFLWVWCEATVTVVDAEGKHVKGATVYGRWSGSVTGTDYRDTGTNGKATFESRWVWRWSDYSFTFTVEDIIKDGWIYDEEANEETSHTVP